MRARSGAAASGRRPPVVVLTVAGSDSGGGAGVLADAKVIRAGGGFAVMAITAVTAQGVHGVRAVEPVSVRMLAQQIAAALEEFPVRAVKVGMLPSAAAVKAVAQALSEVSVPVVVDPVLGPTSGMRFLDRAGVRALVERLFPLATLVTPNWPEAEELSGVTIRDEVSAAEAGVKLLALGCKAVLVKGGHASGRRVTDSLFRGTARPVKFSSLRIDTSNTHGTGCVLSAGIALHLAKGRGLEPAVRAARRHLRASLRLGRGVDWGGRGPVSG